MPSSSRDSFIDITSELTGVSGGRAARRQQESSGGGLFGWFDNIYHSIVNSFAGSIGGKKMAHSMYGKHTTAADEARSSAAMKKFLAGSKKLPKGVPDIFGGWH